MRYALVKVPENIVVNVLILDDVAQWAAPAGHELIEDDPPASSPGFSWDGSAFAAPPGIEPVEAKEE